MNRRLIVDIPQYITIIKMTSKNKSNNRDDLMDSLDESGGEDEGNNNLQKLIFEDNYLSKFQDDKGVRKWRCGWCDKEFSSWNATKTLQHLTKQQKVHIQPCKGCIHQEYAEKYLWFYEKAVRKRKRNAINHNQSRNSIDSMNKSSAIELQARRWISSSHKRFSDTSSYATTVAQSANGKQWLVDWFTKVNYQRQAVVIAYVHAIVAKGMMIATKNHMWNHGRYWWI
jgi:hypothetical protein